MTRILVDLLGYTGQRGGTETYARQICRELSRSLPGVELHALVNAPSREKVEAFFPGEVHPVAWVRSDRLTWAVGEVLAVNRSAKRLGADVVWSPANFGPVNRRAPFVLTFHDVVYRDWRGNLLESVVRYTAWKMMVRSSRVADLIITGSHAAAAELNEFAAVPREKIRVIPHGSSVPRPTEGPLDELREIGVSGDRPLLLSTGNRLPHKNFVGLLEAVATLPTEQRPLTVIPGSHGRDPLAEHVSRLGLESDVILPGWVTAPQLEALYSVAALYVCPSLNEGFGLPVVDAMRRGCRVLAHDIPVLREVGGVSARYADATDPDRFGRAIHEAMSGGDDVADREARRLWAEQYSWDASARSTAAALSEAADAAGRDRGGS